MNTFTNIIAKELQLPASGVDGTLQLLDEGCTIPFIARYRKERTGGLDDVQIGDISARYDKLKELAKRKETILKSIEEQGKLNDKLKKKIEDCWDANTLEDIYLPFKPKRRTRAQIAREYGLESLATMILLQRENDIEAAAKRLINSAAVQKALAEHKVKEFTVDDALQAAKDIIAENISESEDCRHQLRATFKREAEIASKVVKAKADSEEAQKYRDYFDFAEPLSRCTGNRLLAMRRGEA